jgi:hypothetical protein
MATAEAMMARIVKAWTHATAMLKPAKHWLMQRPEVTFLPIIVAVVLLFILGNVLSGAASAVTVMTVWVALMRHLTQTGNGGSQTASPGQLNSSVVTRRLSLSSLSAAARRRPTSRAKTERDRLHAGS